MNDVPQHPPTVGADRRHLPQPGWQPVRALHSSEVGMLQHRAGTLGDISQHGDEHLALGQPSHCGGLREQPGGRRTSTTAGIGEHGHQPQLVTRAVCELDDRVVVPLPGRAEPELDGLAESARAADPHAGQRCRVTTVPDQDLNRLGAVMPPASGPLVRPHRRPTAERGWPARQHRRPRALLPGQWAGVVHVHARMDLHPLPPTQHPRHLDPRPPADKRLAAADHPVLPLEQLPDLAHDEPVVHAAPPRHLARSRLWTRA